MSAESVLAIVGPVIDIEPVCPICCREGAERVFIRADETEVSIPVYLSWCAAHGVHAPVRDGYRIPYPFREESRSIRCSSPVCSYRSHPSAFCRPTGPPRKR